LVGDHLQDDVTQSTRVKRLVTTHAMTTTMTATIMITIAVVTTTVVIVQTALNMVSEATE
jgi:hypothetical protein